MVMMKTGVILLFFVLFLHWAVVSSGVQREKVNERVAKRDGPESWMKRANIVNGGTGISETGGSLEDGLQKSGARGAGLKRRETRSVQEASSGTDWGGLFLRVTDRQVKGKEDGNFPPIMNLLRSTLKQFTSIPDNLLRQNRRRRSLDDLDVSYEMDSSGDEEEVRKIVANAKAKLSTVDSDTMRTFQDNSFGDNWLFFVLPYSSAGFTEALFKQGDEGGPLHMEKWGEDEMGVNSEDDLEVTEFGSVDLYENVEKDEEATELNGKQKSTVQRLNLKVDKEYTDEISTETDWINMKANNNEARSGEKHETDEIMFLKEVGRSDDRSERNGKHLTEGDEYRNGNEDYRDIKVNVDIKNGETLFGDISIDTTMDYAVGSDKLSAAELPVKIPETHNEARQNKRLSRDKSHFISVPLASLSTLEGDAENLENDKESTHAASDTKGMHQSLEREELVDGEIHREASENSKSAEETLHANEQRDIETVKGEWSHEKLSSTEEKKKEREGKIDEKQREEDIEKLKLKRLIQQLSNMRKLMMKKQNQSVRDDGKLVLEASRIDESAKIDSGKDISEEYDKQRSAAETSIHADVNKRGRVKHRGDIGEKSTSAKDVHVEREMGRGGYRDEKKSGRKKERNVQVGDRSNCGKDSRENIKHEWTPLGGKERGKSIVDMNSRTEKHEKENSGRKKIEMKDSSGEKHEKVNEDGKKSEIESSKSKRSHEQNLEKKKLEIEDSSEKEHEQVNEGRKKYKTENSKIKQSRQKHLERKKVEIEHSSKEKHEKVNEDSKKSEIESSKSKQSHEDNLETKKLEIENSSKEKYEKFNEDRKKFGIESSKSKQSHEDNLETKKLEIENSSKEKYEKFNEDRKKFGIESSKSKQSHEDNLETKKLEIENSSKKEHEQVNEDTKKYKTENSKIKESRQKHLERKKVEIEHSSKEKQEKVNEDSKKSEIESSKSKQSHEDNLETKKLEIENSSKEKYEKFNEDKKKSEAESSKSEQSYRMNFEKKEIEKEGLRKSGFKAEKTRTNNTNERKVGLENTTEEMLVEANKERKEFTASEHAKEKELTVENSKEKKSRVKAVKSEKFQARSGRREELESANLERSKFQAESSRMGSTKTNKFGSQRVAGKKEFGSGDLEEKKVKVESLGSEKFKAGSLTERELGSRDSGKGKYALMQDLVDQEKLGSMNFKKEKSEWKDNEKLKHLRHDELLTRGDKRRLEESVSHNEYLDAEEGNVILKRNELSKYSKEETIHKEEDSRAIRKSAAEATDEKVGTDKEEHEISSHEESSRSESREREISEHRSKERGKLISREGVHRGLNANKAFEDAKYNSQEKHAEINTAKMEGNKMEQMELSVKEKKDKTSEVDRKSEGEHSLGKLSLDTEILDEKHSKVEIGKEENSRADEQWESLKNLQMHKESSKVSKLNEMHSTSGKEHDFRVSSKYESNVAGESKSVNSAKRNDKVEIASHNSDTNEATGLSSITSVGSLANSKGKDSSASEAHLWKLQGENKAVRSGEDDISEVETATNTRTNPGTVTVNRSDGQEKMENHGSHMDLGKLDSINVAETSEYSTKHSKIDKLEVLRMSKENREEESYKKVEVDEASKRKSNINCADESLSKKQDSGRVKQQESKMMANDASLEVSWEAINKKSKEKLGKGERIESDMAAKRLSQHRNSEIIDSLSHRENGEKRKGEKEKEAEEAFSIADRKLESNSRLIERVSTEKNSEKRRDRSKVEEIKNAEESKEEHSIKEFKTDAFKESEHSLTSHKGEEISLAEKNSLNEAYKEENDREASLETSKSIRHSSDAGEVVQKESETKVQVTKDNDVDKETEQSSSSESGHKAVGKKVSLSDLSVESCKKNDKLRGKQDKRLGHSSESETRWKGDEIRRINMEEEKEGEALSTARQLIEDNELKAFSATSIRTALNTKTTGEAHPSELDENPIIPRLPEGAPPHSINWADNKRYKELSTEADLTREKTQARTEVYGSAEARLSKLKSKEKVTEWEEMQSEEGKNSIGKATTEKSEGGKVEASKDEEAESLKRKEVTNLESEAGKEKRRGRNHNVMELGKIETKGRIAEGAMEKYNDISVEVNKYGEKIEGNELVNDVLNLSHVSVSLSEKDLKIGNENVLRGTEKTVDTSDGNEKIKGREEAGAVDREHDVEKKNVVSESSDENRKSKMSAISHVEKGRDVSLKAGEQVSWEKEENVSEELSNKKEASKMQSAEHKKLNIEDSDSEVSGRKLKHKAESYPDEFNFDMDKMPAKKIGELHEDKVQTQIRKPLTEDMLTMTELPRLKPKTVGLEGEKKVDSEEKKEHVLSEDRDHEAPSNKHAEKNEGRDLEDTKEHKSVESPKNRKILPTRKLPNKQWSSDSGQHPQVNMEGTNVLSSIPVTENPENAHLSPNTKEEPTKSSNPLSHVPRTRLSSKEIPDAKFVRKLQPSSKKFTKPPSEVVNKSGPSASVSAPSKRFKSHPNEREPTKPDKSSCTSLCKLLGLETIDDDLCTILRSFFLFTHFPNGAENNEGGQSTYGGSIDGKDPKVEGEHKKGETVEPNSVDEPSNAPQKLDEKKMDVYIVKQASKGPVKIAHVENMKPFILTSKIIPRNTYEKMIDLVRRNQIKSSHSVA